MTKQSSAPIEATVVQFLMPFRRQEGRLELLLRHQGIGKKSLELLTVSPSYAIWERVNSEQEYAPDLLLRGTVTDALSVMLKHREHKVVGTTEPFFYLMAKARNDYPSLAIGYVVDYILDELPDEFFWASFSDICLRESSVFPIYGPSDDPEPFQKMLKQGSIIFEEYWLKGKQIQAIQSIADQQ